MQCDKCYKEFDKLYRWSPRLAFYFCRECMEKMAVKDKAQQDNKKGKTA